MDQKSTVFGVPWHGSQTTILQDSSHDPGAKRKKKARSGSGIYENQHNLVKPGRNFDASPAVTTGMPQDPYLRLKRVETARSAAWGASPLNPPRHESLAYATAGVSRLFVQKPSPQIHVNMHLNHIIMMIILKKVTFR